MLQRLRTKFIAMIMAVVAIILLAVFACILVWISHEGSDHLHRSLESAIDRTVEAESAPEPAGRDKGVPEDSLGWFEPPELGKPPAEPMDQPVAVYRLEDDSLTLASRSSALLDAEGLEEARMACEAAPKGFSSIPALGLSFLKRTVDSCTYVAFAFDTVAESQRSLIIIFAGVGAAALLVFLVASILFSRWALRPVRAAWDQQRSFIANASHELKTPLSIIKANTEVLLEEPEAPWEERVHWLKSTQGAADGMADLAEDLLSLASLDERARSDGRRDGILQTAEVVDASRILEGVVLSFESRALERGFSLETDIQEGVLSRLDGAGLTRIASVLVDNACKYVEPGSRVSVRLSAQRSEEAVLEVTNAGQVLDPEVQAHIFDRFYRSPEARAMADGHGLGLSIAQALADQMGARISVNSADGLTTFSLTFPVRA